MSEELFYLENNFDFIFYVPSLSNHYSVFGGILADEYLEKCNIYLVRECSIKRIKIMVIHVNLENTIRIGIYVYHKSMSNLHNYCNTQGSSGQLWISDIVLGNHLGGQP